MIKDNNFIRKEADNLLTSKLRKLFYQNNTRLKEHSASAGEDNGTDFYFDVTNENEKHIFFFRNQNKGTFEKLNKIKTQKNINYGKISYQISLRNAINYYYELDEAIIFTICDLNTKNIYWYDIQNDLNLSNRIEKQHKKDVSSISIYVPTENILDEDTFELLLQKIELAKQNQIRKKKTLSETFEADYSKIEVDIKDYHIIDQIHYTIKLFEGIQVLPENIISKLPPFKGNNKNETYISGFTLYTDNECFFNFIDTISLSENTKPTIGDTYVENQEEKLKDIVLFLLINHINHIVWRGKESKNKICVHKLFKYNKCDCERCNLERLNFKKTYEILDKNIDDNSLYEGLKRGYTYYLLGDYKTSAEVFYSLYNDTDIIKNPVKYTILTYNLTKLKRLVKSYYYEKDINDISEKLAPINFNIDEPLLNKVAPYFLDIFKNIKEQKFYEEVKDDIEECFLKIQEISFKDKYGTSFSDNKYEQLMSSFLRFTSYLEHNFIIFSQYIEFKDITKKVLECIFGLYAIKSPMTNRYEKFDWSILNMWIFYVDEEHSKYLLNKYNIKKIVIDEVSETLEQLNELITNLIDSNDSLDKIDDWYSPINIKRILNRILQISALLDVEYQKKEQILLNIITLCKILKNKYDIPYEALVGFIEKNEAVINKIHIREILDLFIHDEREIYEFGRSLNIYAEKCTTIEIEDFIKTVLKINSLDNLTINIENRYTRKLFYSFTFLNDDFKEKLKENIINSLTKEFDNELYNLATIYDLIGFDENLFNQFIATIPDMSRKEDDDFPFFKSYDSFRLGQVINLVYKYNLEFTEELKSLTKKSHPNYLDYYCWLMDIDNFDYSKFNPYWILEFKTIHYLNRFKKSQRLKEELCKALNNNYIEGVAKIYFKNLV